VAYYTYAAAGLKSVRLLVQTEEVENLEVLFFSTRLLRRGILDLPVTADLRLASTPPDRDMYTAG
jgi:hypothetical protein